MSIKLSKEFVITYSGETIARCLDFSFEINKTTIDLTSLDSGSWREILADQKEWRINFNALIAKESVTGTTSYDDLIEQIKENDLPVEVIIGGRVATTSAQKGLALITTLSFNASVGDRATYAGTLEGTGALETITVQ